MRRRLFTAVTIGSLLLCVATVVLWLRSYWAADCVLRISEQYESHWFTDSRWALVSEYGGLELWHYRARQRIVDITGDLEPAGKSQVRYEYSRLKPGHGPLRWRFGIGRADQSIQPDLVYKAVGLSHWLLVSILGLSVVLALNGRSRSRYQGHSFCRRCGYDLRGTPDRCPECGTVISKSV